MTPVLRRILWLPILALILVAMAVFGSIWLPWPYNFLDVSETPQRADFVVLLGGGDFTRAQKAAELYQQGYAPRVLVSGGPLLQFGIECSTTQLAEEDVSRLGLPSEAILTSDFGSSTKEEAQEMLRVLSREGATSALVVTDTPHTRRARATYRQLLGDQHIRLMFVGADLPSASSNWWRDESGLIEVQNEFVKLGYYLLLYGIWPF